jgi:hypothetical protein
MQDRRKHQRKDLIYQLKIFNLDDNSFFGHLKNITEEGIMIVSGSEREVNVTHRIRMDLPKTIEGTNELVVKALILWTKKEIDTDYFISGLKLIDVSESEKEIIQLLIEHFAIK